MLTKVDKAIAAFILAAAGSFGTAQVADADLQTKLISAAVVGLIAAFGVWVTPNKTPVV